VATTAVHVWPSFCSPPLACMATSAFQVWGYGCMCPGSLLCAWLPSKVPTPNISIVDLAVKVSSLPFVWGSTFLSQQTQTRADEVFADGRTTDASRPPIRECRALTTAEVQVKVRYEAPRNNQEDGHVVAGLYGKGKGKGVHAPISVGIRKRSRFERAGEHACVICCTHVWRWPAEVNFRCNLGDDPMPGLTIERGGNPSGEISLSWVEPWTHDTFSIDISGRDEALKKSPDRLAQCWHCALQRCRSVA